MFGYDAMQGAAAYLQPKRYSPHQRHMHGLCTGLRCKLSSCMASELLLRAGLACDSRPSGGPLGGPFPSFVMSWSVTFIEMKT
jgi:hypothetical protein